MSFSLPFSLSVIPHGGEEWEGEKKEDSFHVFWLLLHLLFLLRLLEDEEEEEDEESKLGF